MCSNMWYKHSKNAANSQILVVRVPASTYVLFPFPISALYIPLPCNSYERSTCKYLYLSIPQNGNSLFLSLVGLEAAGL